MRGDPGFFAVDRMALRRAEEELRDVRALGLFVALSVDATDGVVPFGNARDIATYYGGSTKGIAAILVDLTSRGWIEWNKPTNQWAEGSIRIVRDLERKHRRAPSEMGEAFDGAPPRASPRASPHAYPLGSAIPEGAPRGNGTHKEQGTRNKERVPNFAARSSTVRAREAEEDLEKNGQRRRAPSSSNSNGDRPDARTGEDPMPLNAAAADLIRAMRWDRDGELDEQAP